MTKAEQLLSSVDEAIKNDKTRRLAEFQDDVKGMGLELNSFVKDASTEGRAEMHATRNGQLMASIDILTLKVTYRDDSLVSMIPDQY